MPFKNSLLKESQLTLTHFLQVAYPHCATCFGRCYPGGVTLILDAKNLYDGIGRLLTVSSSRELPKTVSNAEEKTITENGDMPALENGATSDADKDQKSPSLISNEKQHSEGEAEQNN